MSRPRAILGVFLLPLYAALITALGWMTLLWAVFCDAVPAGIEEIKREWRE